MSNEFDNMITRGYVQSLARYANKIMGSNDNSISREFSLIDLRDSERAQINRGRRTISPAEAKGMDLKSLEQLASEKRAPGEKIICYALQEKQKYQETQASSKEPDLVLAYAV